jgi:hypothetical protein
LLIALGLLLAAPSAAQTSFTEITPANDPLFVTPSDEDFWLNAVAPADVDGDGDLDLALIGFYVVYNVSATDMLVILLNEGPDPSGDWTFTHQPVDLGALSAGASDLAWGDYDGDGDPDLAVGSNGMSVVYRNDLGALVQQPNVFPGYFEDSGYTGAYDLRSLTWADHDNDGDLDLLIPSVFDFNELEFATVLMRNDGPDGSGGWLFSDAGAALDATVHAQSAWADDDADGDLDLLLVNVDNFLGTNFIRRYTNTAGAMAGEDLLSITIEYGLADWGDHDLDGDLDILVAGLIQEAGGSFDTVLRVYTNEGGGTYTETTIVDNSNWGEWLDIHAATWADYDSDGDVDILATGTYIGPSEIQGRSEVFENDGGVFTALGVGLEAPISSSGRGGTFTWLDIDNDGDLEYFVAGSYYVPGGNGLVESRLHLFRNDVLLANNPPTAPAGLAAQVDGNDVSLSWESAVDDTTPAEAITYELELSRLAGAPVGATVTRRLPEPGNLSAVAAWQLRDLPAGSYAWRLRAVDTAFNGGPWAQGSFQVGGAPLALTVEGSCPGNVVVRVTGATPRSEAGVVAAANANGFVKGGVLCAGTRFGIGEPFRLPPTWIRTDASGTGSAQIGVPQGFCFVEAIDLATCRTSGAVAIEP